MKLLYAMIIFLVSLGFTGCSQRDLAMMHPVGTYTENMPEGERPVHFIAQERDNYGNYLPAYLSIKNTVHTEAFVYPAPTWLQVTCERGTERGRQYGQGNVKKVFELGKSYDVYCEELPQSKFKIVAEEVGVAYQKEEKPSDENRITFLTGDTDPLTMWIWLGSQVTGVKNWDGKTSNKAELTGPRTQIIVFCRRESLYFPIKGDFQVGKTYQVICSENRRVGYPEVIITDITEQK